MPTANIITHQKITKLEDVSTSEQANAIPCVAPFAIAHTAAVDAFKKKVAKQSNITDEHILRFLRAVSFVENHRASYSFRDIVIHAKWFLDIGDVPMLFELFTKYTSTLVSCGKLSVIENLVNDEIVYVIQ